MLLDDAHRLDEADQVALFEALGRRLRNGRVLATSRELLRLDAGAPDRFEMRLSGISEDAAKLLWAHLDVLYGVSAGLDHIWQRSRGNPFVLRRAHAGDLDEDPINSHFVSVKRLRTLLAGSGVDIEFAEQGYLLRVPERFAYVSKLDPAAS